MPVIIDGDGNCQIYVDASADLDGALDIVVNAKTSRPSVCNAAESLIVHDGGRRRVLAAACAGRSPSSTSSSSVTPGRAARWAGMGEATDDDFAAEFLSLKLAVAVVPSTRRRRSST